MPFAERIEQAAPVERRTLSATGANAEQEGTSGRRSTRTHSAVLIFTTEPENPSLNSQ
jgi:hypothetical protein